jgi:maleate isomerase
MHDKVDRMNSESDQLRSKFNAILAELLSATKASRTTLRIDDAQHGFHVDDVAGEAVAQGQNSLRGVTTINQRAAATAQWVEKNRRLLVQDDLSQGDPRPPEALIRLYGVRAQMLAPIEREGRLDGWISVHEARHPRHWSSDEQQAVLKAVEQILRAIG